MRMLMRWWRALRRPSGRRSFGRQLALTGLIGALLVLGVLAAAFRYSAAEGLRAHESRNNVALAQALVNALWPRFADFVQAAAALPAGELAGRPEIAALRNEVLRQVHGLPVVKVKIYSVDGLTVFSTDPRQIGEVKAHSAGVQAARRGEVASEIAFRNEFYAIERVIVDRDLVTSYIPVRRAPDGPVEAVFELYSDVTPLVAALSRNERVATAGVIGALAVLGLLLQLQARRADRLIRAQEEERAAQAARLRHQAYHDALTGLPNRVSLLEHLDAAIRRARRSATSLGVLLLDLDHFKLINESLGHEAGDELLRRVTDRIEFTVRESDLLFRLGGDEFVLLVESIESPEYAGLLAGRLLEALTEPLQIAGRDVVPAASIGLALFPKDGATPDALVQAADAALSRAKDAGRNGYQFFTHEMNVLANERLALRAALQRAVTQEEFVLYYQPRGSLASGSVCAVEALLRWDRPGHGIQIPDKFLGYLEESGLIVPVGEWVLKEACRQNRAWQRTGLAPMRVSVNISSRQFRSGGLARSVRMALHDSGLDPRYLELELTETLLVENTAVAVEVLNELKAIGVSISIDDFGSGYSSLNYLKRFPVDYLKIDRSFVRDLGASAKDAAIVSAVAALARNLNIQVVAEGVEQEHQLSFLRDQGCHEVQGYLLSRPVPTQVIEGWLASGKAAALCAPRAALLAASPC